MGSASAVSSHPVGLVLTGGGARAAYQVGVLSAVVELLNPARDPAFRNPFPVICGTSAGAINAAALACRAHEPQVATERLCQLWGGLSTGKIYYADASRLLRTGINWLGMLSLGWLLPGTNRHNPRFFLDNAPLRQLLHTTLDFAQLQRNLAQSQLHAVAVTASDYISGRHVTFYQAQQAIQPWRRTLRQAVPTVLSVDHLMASSAIPFIFPAQAVRVDKQVLWCGDGAMRQLAPISPVIHLGADKVFVIGTGFQDETRAQTAGQPPPYPALAQIGGHALANIFLDSVAVDIERVQRINDLLAQSAGGIRDATLRHLDVLVINPSQSLEAMAMDYLAQAPKAVRMLFRVLGVSGKQGAQTGGVLVSYLLFESDYTRALIALGHGDCMKRQEEVKAFFRGCA